MEEDYRLCPICQNSVLWDDMVWLDGICTCPSCYIQRRECTQKRKEDMDEDKENE